MAYRKTGGTRHNVECPLPIGLEVLGVASPHRRDREVGYYFCRSAEVTRPSSFSYGTKRNLNVKVL